MIDPQINSICKLVHEWCGNNSVLFDIVCDESDIQGVMLFKKDSNKVKDLISYITPSIDGSDVHLETTNVRGGTVITFSLSALSEQTIGQICSNYGREVIPMNFIEKLNKVFDIRDVNVEVADLTETTMTPVDSLEADESLEEGQYKSATSGMSRGQKRDDYLTYNQSSKGATKGASKGPDKKHVKESFDSQLVKALAEQEESPDVLFKQFARALRVLGTKMGIGPIQDKLKQQGINWKQSADGRDIILTIRNATTQTDQPIARITYETLTNPADFENQLKSMLDFAMGDAPGASAQLEKEISDRKKTVSDIAKAVQPTDQESEVAQQMNVGLGTEQQAAETAAMPK